jgi:hypothetical protein
VSVTTWNCYGGDWEAQPASGGEVLTGGLARIQPYLIEGPFPGRDLSGHFHLKVTVGCLRSTFENETWGAEIWLDPSGVVVNQYGAPLEGAELSLLRSDESDDGGFAMAEPGAHFAASQANPQVTGADGVFEWDVLAGDYKVRAQAAGAEPIETPAMTVPPARSGLVLSLTVAGAAPPAPLATPSVTAPVADAAISLGDLTWASDLTVVEDSVTWQADGQAIGAGHDTTLPAASAGKVLTVTVTAHVTREGNKDGIAPQLGGERLGYEFAPFTYELALGRVGGGTGDLSATPSVTPTTTPPTTSPVAPSANAGVEGGSSTTPALQKLVKTPKPVITGTAKVGKVLKATAGKWDTGVSRTYRWYADGKTIKGATKATYKIASRYQGKRITVKITGKKTGYKTVVKTSKKTPKIRAA